MLEGLRRSPAATISRSMKQLGATVQEAALHFGVSVETVRRWLRAGAPCLSPGSVGPGHGALVDLAALERWRGQSRPESDRDVLPLVQTALHDVLRRDGGTGRPLWAELRVSPDAAASLLWAAYRRIAHALNSGVDV